MSKLIIARQIPAVTPLTSENKAGDFQFQDIGGNPVDNPMQTINEDRAAGNAGYARIAFYCLQGRKLCHNGCGIIIGYPHKPDFDNGWQWNGDTKSPTLTPSINCQSCGWHGYLQNGLWREA